MKKERYEKGDILCDMHDGFRGLPDNLQIGDVVRLRIDTASQLITAMVGKHPGNKYLTVVGYSYNFNHIVAAWSYDGDMFGMAELKLKQ